MVSLSHEGYGTPRSLLSDGRATPLRSNHNSVSIAIATGIQCNSNLVTAINYNIETTDRINNAAEIK